MNKKWLAGILAITLTVFALVGYGCAKAVDPETRTVTFMNGSEVYTTQKVVLGEKYVFPQDPKREPDDNFIYIFKGWTLSDNYNEWRDDLVEEPDFVYSDTTLHAVFTKETIDDNPDYRDLEYTVEFRMPTGLDFEDGADGKSYSGVTLEEFTQVVKRYGNAELPAADEMPEIVGYHFTGRWEGGSLTDIRGNRRVTAVYEKNVYTLTQHYLGETLKSNVEYKGAIVWKDAPNVAAAFVFEEWYLDDNFTQRVDLQTMPARDLDVYAKYHIDFSQVTVLTEGDMVYGDAENSLYIAGLLDTEGLEYTISWTVNGQNMQTSERKMGLRNAGLYQVSVHIRADYKNGIFTDEGDATNSQKDPHLFEFILEKATLTARVSLSTDSIVYGEAAPKPSATYEGFVFEDTADTVGVDEQFVYLFGSEDVTGRNLHVGTYTVETRAYGMDNYRVEEIAPLTFTVTQKALTVSLRVDNFEYGMPFVPEIGFEGFVFDDAITLGDLGEHWFILDGNGEIREDALVHAGTHRVVLRGYDSKDYIVSLPEAADFSVARRTASATTSAQDFTYGQDAAFGYALSRVLDVDKAYYVPTYSVTKGGAVYDYGAGKHFTAGEYVVTAVFAGSDDYEPIVVEPASFTVEKKALTATVVAEDITYGERPAPVVFFEGWVYGEGESVFTRVPNPTYFTESGDSYGSTVFVAGKYSVVLSGYEAANYTVASAEDDFTVHKALLTLTVELNRANGSYLYGETPAPSAATGTDIRNGIRFSGFVNNENINIVFGNNLPRITYQTAAGQTVSNNIFHAGSYVATTGASLDNYEVKVVSQNFTVHKRSLEVSVSFEGDENGVYIYGTVPAATVVYGGDGFLSDAEREQFAGNAFVRYAGEYTYDQPDLASGKRFIVAGSYTVTVEEIGEGVLADYELTYAEQSLTVSPKALRVVISGDKAAYTYGDTPVFTPDYKNAGFVYGENESLFGENAFAYLYTLGGGTYLHTATYFGASESVYTASLALENANYDITVVPAKFTVGKKALTVSVRVDDFTYGGTFAPVPAFEGFAEGESAQVLTGAAEFTYTRGGEGYDFRTFFDAGSYAVAVSGFSSENYAITYTGDTFTVAQKELTLTITGVNERYVYGTRPESVAVEYDGLIAVDEAAFRAGNWVKITRGETDVTSAEKLAVGTYSVTSTYENANYTFTAPVVEFGVTRASLALSVALDRADGIYTYGTRPVPAVSYSGFVLGETAEGLRELGELTVPASAFVYRANGGNINSNITFVVGTAYSIALSQTFAATNYTITYEAATPFTVSPKALTVSFEVGDITYGERPAPVLSIEGFISGQSLSDLGDYSFVYDGEANPRNYLYAGVHRASVVFASPNANYSFDDIATSFTVSPKEITVSVSVAGFTYGGAYTQPVPQPSGLVEGDVLSDLGTLTYTLTGKTYGADYTTAHGLLKADIYTLVVSGFASDNYELAPQISAGFTVAQKALTLTIAGVNANYVYGTRPTDVVLRQSGLVSADAADFDGAAWVILSGSSNVTNAQKLGVGSYTVASTFENANYTFAAPSVTFSVTRAALSVVVTEASDFASFKYDGKSTISPSYDFEGFVLGEGEADLDGAISYTLTGGRYTLGNVPSVLNADTYVFTAGGFTSENYEITYVYGSERKSAAEFTVLQRAVTLTLAAGWTTYGEDASHETWYTLSGDDVLGTDLVFTPTVLKGGSAYAGGETYFSVGTYTVQIGYTHNPNYTVAVVGGQEKETGVITHDFTVAPRTFTVMLNNVQISWANRNAWSQTISISADLERLGFSFEGTIALLNAEERGADTFTASSPEAFAGLFRWVEGPRIMLGDANVTENFTLEYAVTLILSDSEFRVTPPAETTFDFNGAEREFAITAEADGIDQDDITILYYSSTDADETVDESRYSKEIPAFLDAGVYTVRYIVRAENSKDSFGSFTVTINKVAYRVTVDRAQSKTYDREAFGSGVTVQGVSGDLAFVAPEVTYTLDTVNGGQPSTTAPQITNVTESGTVTFTVPATKNYFAYTTNNTYTLTVLQAEVEIPVIAHKTYSGETQTADIAENPLYTVVNNGGKDAGDYKVTLTLEDSANYRWKGGDCNPVTLIFVIDKAQLDKPTASTQSFTYNKSVQTYEPNGFDASKMTIENNEQTDADEYSVIVGIRDTKNYEWKGSDQSDPTFSFVIAKGTIVMDGVEWNYSGPFTYDNTSKSVALVNLPEEIESVSYSGDHATNAGTSYEAVATFTYDTKNYHPVEEMRLAWVINKAEARIDVSEVITEYTYTGSVQSVNLGAAKFASDIEGATGYGGITYRNASGGTITEFRFTDVNTGNNVKLTFVLAEGENFLSAEREITLTVHRAETEIHTDALDFADFTGEGTEYAATYRGSAFEVNWLAATATLLGSDFDITSALTYEITEGPSTASILNAGTYTMVFTVTGNSNFNGTTLTFTITIGKAKLTVTAPNYETTQEYSEGANLWNNAAVTGAFESDVYTVSYATSYEAFYENGTYGYTERGGVQVITNAGRYTVKLTVSVNSDNYELEGAGEDGTYVRTFHTEITRLAGEIDVSGVQRDYTYTGHEQKVESGAVIVTGVGTLVYTDNAFTTVSEGDGKVVTITLPESLNYEEAKDTVTLSVAKANYTVEFAAVQSRSYNGEAYSGRGITVKDAKGDVVSRTVTYAGGTTAAPSVTNVSDGTKTVTFTVAGDENHNDYVEETGYTLSVTPAALTVGQVAPQSKEYNGANQFADIKDALTVETLFGGDTFTVSYRKGNEGEYQNTLSFVNVTDSGTVYFLVTAGSNYAPAEGSYKFDITPAALTLSAENVEKEYCGQTGYALADYYNKFTLNGLKDGETFETLFDVTANGNLVNVGEYTVTAALKSTVKNYTASGASFTFTITRKAIHVSKPVLTETYTGSAFDKGLIVNEADLAQGDTVADALTITYTYLNESNSSVAPKFINASAGYAVTAVAVPSGNYYVAEGKADGSNYTATYTVVINKAQVVIEGTYSDVSGLTYSGNARHTVVVPEANFGTVVVEILYTAFDGSSVVENVSYLREFVDAGTYLVRFSVADDANWDGDVKEFTVTINQLALTVVEKNRDIDAVYNKANHFVALTESDVIGRIGDEALTFEYSKNNASYTQSGLSFVNVGDSGTVYFRISAGRNYTTVYGSYTITIEKATLTALPEGVTVPSFEGILMQRGKTFASLQFSDEHFAWSENIKAEEISGTGAYKAIYTDASGNYLPYEVEIDVVTRKQQITITANNIELQMSSNLNLEAIQNAASYALQGENGELSNEDLEGITITVSVTETNAVYTIGGTYYVLYTVTMAENIYYELSVTEVYRYLKLQSIQSGNNYYTIEDALKNLTGTIKLPEGTTSFMDATTKDILDTAGVNPYPDASYYMVRSGVILSLPYDGENTHTYNTAATSSLGNASYRKLELRIPEGITITNAGTIIIGGITSGGSGGRIAGQTSAEYAQITLGEGAGIVSTGKMEAWGFIVEETKDNGSFVTVTGGSLTMPFIVVEHRGGSKFYNINNSMKGSPFNRFYLQNVTPTLTVESSAMLYAHANLYADSQNNTTDIQFVGGDSSSNFIALKSGSKFVSKYDIDTQVSKWDIYGSISLNSLSLTIKVKVSSLVEIPVPLSTSKVMFPLTWYFDITFRPATDGGTATVNTTSQDIKIMPGASLTVAKGVTMTAKNIFVYDESFTDPGIKSPVDRIAASLYETGKGAGKLIVNGNLTATGIGGRVRTTEDGATLKISGSSSTTSYELVNADDIQWMEYTKYLELRVYDRKANTISASYVNHTKIGSYESKDGGWLTDRYYIEYDANGGTLSGNSNDDFTLPSAGETGTITGNTITTSNPTRKYHTFEGWYYDIDCMQKVGDTARSVGAGEVVTVYAKWKPITYSIKFEVDYLGNYNGEKPDIPEDMTWSYGTPVQLPIPDKIDGLSFSGWFIKDNYTEEITQIDDSNIDLLAISGNTITIYANFVEEGVFAVQYNSNGHYEDELAPPTDETGKVGTTVTGIGAVNAMFAKLDDNVHEYYFVGWTANGKVVDASTTIDESYLTNGVLVLSAQWERKATIKIRISIGSLGGTAEVTLTYNGGSIKETTTASTEDSYYYFYLKAGTTVNYSIKLNGSKSRSASISGAVEGTVLASADTSSSNGTHTGSFTMPAAGKVVTVNASAANQTCVIEGTLVTLADGTQKKVEELRVGELILVFNHETGKYDVSPVMFNAHIDNAAELVTVTRLKFSDGTELGIVGEHALFDLDLLKYVYLDQTSAFDYIGHRFVEVNNINGEFVSGEVVLTGVTVAEEAVRIFSPVSVYHLNAVTNNLLSLTTFTLNSDAFANFFEFGEDLKYDGAKMQADIEKYGLYSYEDFKDYMTEEMFEAIPWKYWKVSVGKGMLTWNDILALIDFIYNSGQLQPF